jgi:hypothetical protein
MWLAASRCKIFPKQGIWNEAMKLLEFFFANKSFGHQKTGSVGLPKSQVWYDSKMISWNYEKHFCAFSSWDHASWPSGLTLTSYSSRSSTWLQALHTLTEINFDNLHLLKFIACESCSTGPRASWSSQSRVWYLRIDVNDIWNWIGGGSRALVVWSKQKRGAESWKQGWIHGKVGIFFF